MRPVEARPSGTSQTSTDELARAAGEETVTIASLSVYNSMASTEEAAALDFLLCRRNYGRV